MVTGDPRSGKTQLARYMLKYHLQNEDAKHMWSFVHLDCLGLEERKTLQEKLLYFHNHILLTNPNAERLPNTATDGEIMIKIEALVDSWKDYTLVSLDEYQMFYLHLSKDDRGKLSTFLRNLLLRESNKVYWTVTGIVPSSDANVQGALMQLYYGH